MKKILLLGDSISMGYREYVRRNLEPFYEVVYPYENGKFAAHVYRMLYEWSRELGLCAENVEMVYWNCGLWDVVRVFQDEPQTTLDIYAEYLERTYKRLRKLFPKAKICFASTTPIIENGKGYDDNFYRLNHDILKYNEIAKKTLVELDLFDDLYQFVCDLQVTEEDYKDATHFNNVINRMIADHISKVILGQLPVVEERISEKMKKEEMELVAKKIFSKNLPIALWGAGRNCKIYQGIIKKCCDVKFVIDKNPSLNGTLVGGVPCESPKCLKEEKVPAVVVMIDNPTARDAVIEYCKNEGIEVCGYRELLNEYYPMYEEKILKDVKFTDADPDAQDVMKRYIGINVPAYGCNFECCYCYLDNKAKGKGAFPKYVHLPEYVRYRLSKEKLGGCALIGICGYGETLLADKIADICAELLKEGHYLHIVTNGIVTKEIQNILEKAGKYRKHIIFKLSFHYLELKNKKLLDKFVENVKLIGDSEASYTIELMPHDELIEYIPEIKEFSLDKFGAYPQLTIGRDEHSNRKLLTNYSNEEYKKIWSVFDSGMFDFRMNGYLMHGRNCNAGKHSFFIDLYTGQINRCVFQEGVANFYDDSCNYDFERVGDKCPLDYCFNCHVYATLGLMPDVPAPTYMDIRDRVRMDGSHWLKDDMRRFLDIKLNVTNAQND